MPINVPVSEQTKRHRSRHNDGQSNGHITGIKRPKWPSSYIYMSRKKLREFEDRIVEKIVTRIMDELAKRQVKAPKSAPEPEPALTPKTAREVLLGNWPEAREAILHMIEQEDARYRVVH